MKQVGDKEILQLLKENSRYSNKNISTMLNIPETQVKESIERLEQNGTIIKYTTLINAEKLSQEKVEALIEVRVTPQKNRGFDAIAEDIYAFEQVTGVFLMSGGYDLTVLVEGKSLREVAMFVSEKLSTLNTVVSTATHFILKKYKESGVTLQQQENNNRLAVHP